MRRGKQRPLLTLAVLAAISPGASAYYYYVFFASGTAPYASLAAHYDMNVLKDSTVQYFISDQAPGPLMPGDSLTAIYSEIRQAAAVWNGVASSALRLHFGGPRKMDTPQAVPGIDVVFDDNMPPGIIAQTKISFPADLKFLSAKETTFVPILRAKLQLRQDLTAAGYQQPSYSDAFLMTLVHEFGHALGLQHSFTSAAMSTAATRATKRGAPLAADDVSAISLLYPVTGAKGGYAAATGSIAGRVTVGGAGVNLGSVVALGSSGIAVSAMTNPDGNYRIDGLPPGQYYVYAHPLPPAQIGEELPANITPQVDAKSDSFIANIHFKAQFFPGTQDWTKAMVIGVSAGTTVPKIDFRVTASSGPTVYAMQTYGYPNGEAIPAPPLVAKTRDALVFYANGTTINKQSAIAPGLGVSVVGGAASIEAGTLSYYRDGFLLAVVNTAEVSTNVPAALAVTLNGDLYVLPAAFTVVPAAAPTISSVTTQAVSLLQVVTNVAGTNLTTASRVLFDGSPAKVLWANADGSLAVFEPPGLSGTQATVEAINSDGQSSLQSLGTASRPLFTYPQSNAVELVPTPDRVAAGTDTWMAIHGVNTHFAEGETVVGFGSSDISVRGSWVIDPGTAILNLSADPATQPGFTYLTVATGLEIVTLPAAIAIAAAVPNQISLRAPILNSATGLAGIPAGGTARIATTGLPSNLDGWTISIGGLNTAFTVDKDGVLTTAVPATLAIGPQPVELGAPGAPPAAISRIFLQVDPLPPVILSAVDYPSPPATDPPTAAVPVPVTPSNPAALGGLVTATVLGLSPPGGTLPAPEMVWVNIGGSSYPVTAVAAVPVDPTVVTPPEDLANVTFMVPTTLVMDASVSNPTVSLMVGSGTRLSAPFALNVAAPPPPAISAER